MRRFLISVVLFAAALAGLTGWLAPGASAHSTLVDSQPKANSTVAELPSAVVLTFNEDVQKVGTAIAITGPDGSKVNTGTTTVNGRQVSESIRSAGAGRYTVVYRVTSADGHPISGNFSFTAQGAAASSTSATSAATGSTTSSTTRRLGGGATKLTTTDANAAPGQQPTEMVGTDSTRNQPVIIFVLLIAALLVVAGGVVVARRRLFGDDYAEEAGAEEAGAEEAESETTTGAGDDPRS